MADPYWPAPPPGYVFATNVAAKTEFEAIERCATFAATSRDNVIAMKGLTPLDDWSCFVKTEHADFVTAKIEAMKRVIHEMQEMFDKELWEEDL
jgi:hypothetical protein